MKTIRKESTDDEVCERNDKANNKRFKNRKSQCFVNHILGEKKSAVWK